MICKICQKDIKSTPRFFPWAERINGKVVTSVNNVCYKCNNVSREEVIEYRHNLHRDGLLLCFRHQSNITLIRTKKNWYKAITCYQDNRIDEIDFSIAVLLDTKHLEPQGFYTTMTAYEIVDMLSRIIGIKLNLWRLF